MGQAIGALVQQKIPTDSFDTSSDKLPATLTEADLGKLPATWERQDIDWLLSISEEIEPPEMCPTAHAHKILATWSTSCAKRAEDDENGELRGRLYTRFLTGLTKARADALAKEVLLKCKFFPSIAELHEMTAEPARIWEGAWKGKPTGKPTQKALAAQKTLELIKAEVRRRKGLAA